MWRFVCFCLQINTFVDVCKQLCEKIFWLPVLACLHPSESVCDAFLFACNHLLIFVYVCQHLFTILFVSAFRVGRWRLVLSVCLLVLKPSSHMCLRMSTNVYEKLRKSCCFYISVYKGVGTGVLYRQGSSGRPMSVSIYRVCVPVYARVNL